MSGKKYAALSLLRHRKSLEAIARRMSTPSHVSIRFWLRASSNGVIRMTEALTTRYRVQLRRTPGDIAVNSEADLTLLS